MVSQWKHANSSHYTCWLSSSTVSPCNHSKCVTKAFIKEKQRLADISVINLITLWGFWWSQRRKAGNMRKDKEQGPTIELETHCRMRLNPCGMCPNSELGDLFWKIQFCTCKSFKPTSSLYTSKETDFFFLTCSLVIDIQGFLCLWTMAAFSLLPDLFLSAHNRQVNKEPSLN